MVINTGMTVFESLIERFRHANIMEKNCVFWLKFVVDIGKK